MDKQGGIKDFLSKNFEEISAKALKILPVLHEAFKRHGPQGVTDYAHTYIDAINDSSGLTAKTSCNIGCHFCCYGEIQLSYVEATVIYSAIKQYNIPVDMELVIRQNRRAYHKLKYIDKRCGMLNAKGECKIYDYRPSICRLYNSVDDPKKCNERHKMPSTITLRTIKGFAIATALRLFDQSNKHNEKYVLQKVLAKL